MLYYIERVAKDLQNRNGMSCLKWSLCIERRSCFFSRFYTRDNSLIQNV